eukprot:6142769-Pyramimonas_sp.AAC.1
MAVPRKSAEGRAPPPITLPQRMDRAYRLAPVPAKEGITVILPSFCCRPIPRGMGLSRRNAGSCRLSSERLATGVSPRGRRRTSAR